ncbi:MAG: hypothetical protein IJY96_05015 [Oscillospiraceae bacterium]|nr:hypothetical protein [Oscillospiraceae bacterium]
MAELDKLEREIRSSAAAEKLKAAAASPEGQSVLKNLDTAAVEKAAKAGDMKALRDILSGVLSTPEGQALAKKIRQSMGK